MLKYISPFFLFVLFFVSCKKEAVVEEEIRMIDISKGVLHGAGQEGIEAQKTLITNQSDWDVLVAQMNNVNNVSDGFSQVDVDFEKFQLIAVFDAVKSSGGYSINIDKVYSSDGVIKVGVSSTSPNGVATMAITQPYHIVKIPVSDLPVIF